MLIFYQSNVIFLMVDYTMSGFPYASNGDFSPTDPRSELRTMALSPLARIIAKAYLQKTTVDKNKASEITLPDSQRTSVNDTVNGDGSQL